MYGPTNVKLECIIYSDIYDVLIQKYS